jgi:hypothetical protein
VQFLNDTTLADVTNTDIDVFLLNGEDEVSSLPLCRTFLRAGRLWIDCVPALNRKYVAPVPANVMVSRNEVCLAAGRYGFFVPVGSLLGNLVADLLDLTARKRRVYYD